VALYECCLFLNQRVVVIGQTLSRR